MILRRGPQHLYIKCPETGGLVYTGYTMDRQSFKRTVLEDNVIEDCSRCDGEHIWNKADVVLKGFPRG